MAKHEYFEMWFINNGNSVYELPIDDSWEDGIGQSDDVLTKKSGVIERLLEKYGFMNHSICGGLVKEEDLNPQDTICYTLEDVENRLKALSIAK